MKKLQSIIKLREVLAKEAKVASGYYFHIESDSCCAIGHMFKFAGLTNEQLKELDNGKYGEHSYGIDHILGASVNSQCKGEDIVKEAIEKLGFDRVEDLEFLNDLQKENDRCGKDEVIKKLDNFILAEYGFEPRLQLI